MEPCDYAALHESSLAHEASSSPASYIQATELSIGKPLKQSLVKVVLSRLKIPLNLPLQRETFYFPPFFKRGEGGIFGQT